jgi:glycosyltransferase involved in cell wall biosynthesis
VNGVGEPHRPPEVSVVIPTRNRRRLLALALASALEQQGVEVEAIVVDEGSDDGTEEMVRSLADPRVRLIRHERPLGKSAARNRGIGAATAAWVAFLDDDDLWAPHKLRLQLRELRTTGRRWSYTGAVNITETSRVLGGAPPRLPDEVAESLPRVNFVPGGCSSVVVARAALPAEGFDARYRLCEDWDLWIRLARNGVPAGVLQPLVGYRVHGGNSSMDTRRYRVELEMIDAEHGGPVDRVTFYRHLGRICLRMSRSRSALGHYVRAAARDRSYLFSGFPSDAWGVAESVRDRCRAKLRLPRRPAGRDPHAAWKDEARIWIDDFVRRHAI